MTATFYQALTYLSRPISASAQDSTTQITTDFFVRPQNIQTFRSWVSKVNASTPEMATIISRKWLVDGEPLLEPLGGLLMGFKNYFIDLRTRGQLAPAIDWAMAGTRKYDEKNDSKEPLHFVTNIYPSMHILKLTYVIQRYFWWI